MEFSGVTIAAAVFGVILVAYAFMRSLQDIRNISLLLIGMIFVAGLAVQIDRNLTAINHTYLSPIQALRAPVYLSIAAVLFVVLLVNTGRVKLNNMPAQGFVLLLIQFYTSTLRIFHEGAASGLSSIGFAIITVLPVLLLVPLTLRDWDDFPKLLRTFGFAGFLWTSATAVQVVIDHRQLVMGWQNRFAGLLGNPQGAGLFMAPLAVITLWLLLNDKERKFRPIWYMSLGMLFVYILWTGSRTGAGELALGCLFVLYSRLGKSVLLAPLLVVPLLGAYYIFLALGLSVEAVERLGSTQNTRELSWYILMEDALQNPILGTGMGGTRANENSYLISFGAYGIGGGLLVLTLAVVSLSVMAKIVRYRRLLPRHRKPLADLLLGFNTMFLAGGMFEWYMISRLEGMLIYMFILSCVTRRMMELLDGEISWRAEYGHDYDDYGEEIYDEPELASRGPATA